MASKHERSATDTAEHETRRKQVQQRDFLLHEQCSEVTAAGNSNQRESWKEVIFCASYLLAVGSCQSDQCVDTRTNTTLRHYIHVTVHIS